MKKHLLSLILLGLSVSSTAVQAENIFTRSASKLSLVASRVPADIRYLGSTASDFISASLTKSNLKDTAALVAPAMTLVLGVVAMNEVRIRTIKAATKELEDGVDMSRRAMLKRRLSALSPACIAAISPSIALLLSGRRAELATTLGFGALGLVAINEIRISTVKLAAKELEDGTDMSKKAMLNRRLSALNPVFVAAVIASKLLLDSAMNNL